MGKGSTSTSTTNNQPPQQYLDAYSQVMSQAQNVASQPLQTYPGSPDSMIAGFSPDQLQAMGIIEGSTNIADPYINTAAQYMSNATAPLQNDQFTNYLQQSAGPAVTNAANAGVSGIQGASTFGQANIGNAAAQGVGGITSASQSLTPSQIAQWENPWTQQVVNATQAQFNNQNQQQAAQLQGNAASQGALGGDRLGVAQAQLANQQQLAQAPTIANLESQGYTTGLSAAQQQAQLATQGATAAGQLGTGAATSAAQLGLSGAQGAGTLGLQGATSQAQLQSGAAQQTLGANEAQAWINEQAGFGMANLGSQAQSSALTGANALYNVGSQQQSLAQQYLNIPYEQWVAQQSYPFQTTGWLANIAEGLGSNAGGSGSGSTTSSGGNTASSIAGLGLTGAGIYGLGKDAGWWGSGASAGSGAVADMSSGAFDAATSGVSIPSAVDVAGARGGAVGTRAEGGRIPHRGIGGGLNMGSSMGGGDPTKDIGGAATGSSMGGSDPTKGISSVSMPTGISNVGDASVNIVPTSTSPHAGTMNILKNYGTTSTSSGSDGGSSAVGDVAALASIARLAIAFLDRGGRVPHLASGGIPTVTMQPSSSFNSNIGVPQISRGSTAGANATGVPSVSLQPASYAGGPGVPQISRSGGTSGTSGGTGSTTSGSGSFQDYLNSVLGKIPTSAQLAATMPKTTTSSQSGGAGGGSGNSWLSGGAGGTETGGGTGNAENNAGGVESSADAGAAGQDMGGSGGGVGVESGSNSGSRFGGRVGHFDAGGDTGSGGGLSPDDSQIFGHTSDDAPSFGGPSLSFNPPDPATMTGDGPPAAAAPPSSSAAPHGHQGRGPPTVSAPPSDTQPSTNRPTPMSYDDAMSRLSSSIKSPEKPSPWMALLMAGLGTMAGRSPFAAENIGAGALQGVKYYESEEKDARDLQTRVDEAKARMAESQVQNQQMMDWRYGNQDINKQKADQTWQIAMLKAADRVGRGGGSEGTWSYVGANNDGLPILLNNKTGEQRIGTTAIGMKAADAARVANSTDRLNWQKDNATSRTNALAGTSANQNYRSALHDYLTNNPGATDSDAVSHAKNLAAGAPSGGGGGGSASDPLGIR